MTVGPRGRTLARIRFAIWALCPPVLHMGAKRLLEALGLRPPLDQSLPVPSHDDQVWDAPAAAAAQVPPEWEYVSEGWGRQRTDPRVTGWNVEAIAAAYGEKWPSYLAALEGNAPLGVYHEVASGESVGNLDHAAHNMVISFAYALALAAHGRDRISILDWGGGIGHYYPLSRAVLPGVEIDYHCKDVPVLAAQGRRLFPEATFYEDASCLRRRYDLVLASGSLQYSENWKETLTGLAEATHGYLVVTRLPVTHTAPSFHVLQRAHAYGYDTEYVGWALNRDELLATAKDTGMELVRELLVAGLISIDGAPESPIEHRGFLFRPHPRGPSDLRPGTVPE